MQLQITGHITGIEARNGGWFAVAIQEQGQTYPKKLSTKKPDLIQQSQQMMGQYVDALYNESESTNINPNNGQPYMNRYLEAIAMAGSMPMQPQQQMPQPQQQPQYQPQPVQPIQQPQQPMQPIGFPQPQTPVVTPMQKEERIMREAAAKVAVELLDHLDPADRTLASVVRISEQLVGYFRDGVQWQVPPVQQPVQQQQGGGSEYNPGYAAQPGSVPAQQNPQPQQGYEQPQEDDGIPF